jgi:hypothetical protein
MAIPQITGVTPLWKKGEFARFHVAGMLFNTDPAKKPKVTVQANGATWEDGTEVSVTPDGKELTFKSRPTTVNTPSDPIVYSSAMLTITVKNPDEATPSNSGTLDGFHSS